MKRLLTSTAIAAASLAWMAASAPQARSYSGLATETPTASAADSTASLQVATSELDIIEAAEQSGLTTFVALLEELGMAEDLRGYGRFTVFAPSDGAFSDFLAANPQFQGQLTPELRDQLATLLSYHVIARAEPLTTDNFVSVLGSRSSAQRTLARPDLTLRLRRGDIYANGVEAIAADIEAVNGVIHVVDQVLVPPDGL